MKPTLTRHLLLTVAIALLALTAAPSGAALGHWDRITFSGPAFSEPRLIGFAYDFEQATHHRKPPDSVPPLPDEHLGR